MQPKRGVLSQQLRAVLADGQVHPHAELVSAAADVIPPEWASWRFQWRRRHSHRVHARQRGTEDHSNRPSKLPLSEQIYSGRSDVVKTQLQCMPDVQRVGTYQQRSWQRKDA